MSYDEKALEAKKAEITAIAEGAIEKLTGDSERVANSVIEAFATLTPPERPPMSLDLIVMGLGPRPSAASRKPGNIVLNWRKLVEIIPDATLAATGAKESSWLMLLAALYIWNKLWRAAEEKLTDIEATIILALWKNKNADKKISMDGGYEKANAVRSGFNLSPISRITYEHAINRLLELGCVELENDWLWLREWVRVKYS
jgi:hypothetical protein